MSSQVGSKIEFLFYFSMIIQTFRLQNFYGLKIGPLAGDKDIFVHFQEGPNPKISSKNMSFPTVFINEQTGNYSREKNICC